jgi:hypothetical protein
LTIYRKRSLKESSGFGSRLAPKSTSPQFQRVASLSSCSYDKFCTAQLTYNTDNKVNKLVMVFAFDPAPKIVFECSYRDRTLARLNHQCTGINSRPLINFVPRYSNNLANSCHDWQKPRRTLLATGIISRLKNRDNCRMASSGNAYLLYCRPVSNHAQLSSLLTT